MTVLTGRISRIQNEGISTYLAHDVDGTEAIGDYSVTPGEFYLAPAADEIYHINRLIVTIRDTVGAAASD